MGAGLTQVDIQALVDEAVALQKSMMRRASRLEEIKDIFKEETKKTGQKEFRGVSGIISVSDTTSWTIPVIPFINYIKKMKGKGWESFFENFVTVKYGEVKSKLGTDILQSIGKSEVKPATTARVKF